MINNFDLPLDKIMCPIKDCNQQRTLCVTNIRHRETKQIIGAVVSLQCCECYSRQEDILIFNYSQPTKELV
jgi:hypothetical protein